MRVSIIGSGYVGLVTAACLAEVGNKILCCDIDAAKITQLQNGQSPIYEPGLNELLERNIREQRLDFTTRIEDAVNHAELIFICVGTPPCEDGSADLRHVVKVAQQIATHMNSFKVIINKSTVPEALASEWPMKCAACWCNAMPCMPSQWCRILNS